MFYYLKRKHGSLSASIEEATDLLILIHTRLGGVGEKSTSPGRYCKNSCTLSLTAFATVRKNGRFENIKSAIQLCALTVGRDACAT